MTASPPNVPRLNRPPQRVPSQGEPLLSVRGLSVSFGRGRGATDAVRGVDLDIAPGECVALVGESGSGKSVTARAMLGLAGSGSRVTAERLAFEGRDLRALRPGQWRELRGKRMGLVLQDALVSLDPLRPIGREIGDSLRLHGSLSLEERRSRVIELLESVGMPEAEIRAGQRSGELSGGLRQRALIAAAIAAEPPLIIADEPTTALDVTVQAQVLELLGRLTASGTALLLISHDLAVVAQLADRIAVMRDGEIVEQGPTEQILRNPGHEYTQRLLRAVPAGVPRGIRLSDRTETIAPAVSTASAASAALAAAPNASGEALAPAAPVSPTSSAEAVASAAPNASTTPPVLEIQGVSKRFARRGAEPLLAVDDVSLSIAAGQTLGLVGESGSGKTTVARIALGLESADAGTVLLDGAPWSEVPESERRPRRSSIGAVYQDPLSSFDPRLTVDDVLVDAIGGPRRAALGRVAELLDSVGLPSSVRGRRPLHLSGGQRQRVAIARALAPSPRIIICDEPVSALDVSVQAQVLDLLDELQAAHGIAYLFISHDLDVVEHMSDTVAVMRGGRIVESGEPSQLFGAPAHEYTRQLLAAAPRL